jgi:F-type H+-transporting ATPase subunit a
MNETQTWFNLLPGYENLVEAAKAPLARHWQFLLFGSTFFTLTHVLGTLLVCLFLIYACSRFASVVKKGGDTAILPPQGFGLRALIELFADGALGLMEGVMGHKNARRFFPFICTLAFFIFFNNLLGLIPGFAPPTSHLQTNLALAACVFLVTHVWGVKDHGLGYFKHFLGPIIAWYALPLMILMLIVETISHFARPVSLTLRLLGNMVADHMVVGALTVMVPILIPVPFLLLGVLVSLIQTLVFCMLTMVYISMALGHEEH